MHKRLVTYKFKLKPATEQKEKFGQWLGVCRLIYNLALDIKIQSYKKTGKSVSKNELQTQVKELSKEYDWINLVHSQVRQDPLVRLERTYANFFNGAGFPKFAKKHRYVSFTFPQGVKISDTHIIFPKIGKVKFYKGKRSIDNPKVKQATIKQEVTGWFVSVLIEKSVEALPVSANKTGIDLGIAKFATTSSGEAIDNPRYYQKYLNKLSRAQRKVARRKKGSNRRKKAVIQLKKVHQKIKNCRKDFLHKLSTRLINENQVIAVEDLKFSNMTKSAKGTLESPGKNVKQKSGLNKSMLDLGGHSFFTMLKYKADWYGRQFVKVDPKYTSQTCCICGNVSKENRKTQAFFQCVSCGLELNADHNAAINILGRACPSGGIKGIGPEPEKRTLYSLN